MPRLAGGVQCARVGGSAGGQQQHRNTLVRVGVRARARVRFRVWVRVRVRIRVRPRSCSM